MIYDIEEGSFDLEGIKAACKKSGFELVTYHVSNGYNGAEQRFWGHIQSNNLDGVPRGAEMSELERELEDTDDHDDEFSLTADVRPETFELRVLD